MKARREIVWQTLAAVGCATMLSGVVVGATAGAAGGPVRVGSPSGPLAIQGQPTAWPGANASQAAWQAWASQQVAAVEHTTWAGEVAATGGQLISVTYVPVTSAPDVPAGVTTMSVTLVVKGASGVSIPASAGTTGLSGAVTPSANVATAASGSLSAGTITPDVSGSNCAGITDGSACIQDYSASGGLDIEGSYIYGAAGSVNGHVELSVNGCAGSAVANSANRTLTNGLELYEVYGPVYYTAEWASTFWRNNGDTNYTDFGTVCDSF